MNTDLFNELEKEGYSHLREIPGRGIVGIMNFAFTTAILYGLDEIGYVGRYSYESRYEAIKELNLWDGKQDPGGDWIKHKGWKEYSNPNREDIFKK